MKIRPFCFLGVAVPSRVKKTKIFPRDFERRGNEHNEDQMEFQGITG